MRVANGTIEVVQDFTTLEAPSQVTERSLPMFQPALGRLPWPLGVCSGPYSATTTSQLPLNVKSIRPRSSQFSFMGD